MVMFIFLAQEKGTKRTSTLTHPLPIWRGSNSELQKPTVLSAFWYRGTTRWEMRETPSVPLFREKTYIRHQPSAISPLPPKQGDRGGLPPPYPPPKQGDRGGSLPLSHQTSYILEGTSGRGCSRRSCRGLQRDRRGELTIENWELRIEN